MRKGATTVEYQLIKKWGEEGKTASEISVDLHIKEQTIQNILDFFGLGEEPVQEEELRTRARKSTSTIDEHVPTSMEEPEFVPDPVSSSEPAPYVPPVVAELKQPEPYQPVEYPDESA